MATLLFANNATSTLAGPLSTTSTTCNVAAGSGTLFPQPGNGQYFKMTFIDAATKTVREIVHVTAVSGDTFTIVRGQESTAQANWNAGDIAANLITAGTFANFAQLGNLPTSFVSGQDSGTANAVQVATTTPAVTAPSVGQLFLITKGANGNTGGITFQIASGTVYSVVYKDGSALGAGDWPAGTAALLYFTGGVMQYVANAVNPQVKTYFGRAAGTADAATVATTPTIPALVDGHVLTYVTGASPNATATPTVNPSGLGAVTVVRNDASAVVAGDLPAHATVPVQYDSANNVYRLLWPITPKQVRVKLSGNLNLYVRSDGSDSNTGLANTAAAAFKTPQGCWNAIFGLYDPAGYTITINVGVGVPGTYPAVNFYGYTGSVVLAGDPGNVSGTVVNCGGAAQSPVNVPAGGPNLTIQNLVLSFDFNGTAAPIEATLDVTGNNVVLAGTVTFNCPNNRANLYETYVAGSGAQVVYADNSTIVATGAGSRNCFLSTSSGASMQTGIAVGNVTFSSVGTLSYNTFTRANKNSSQDWSQGAYGGFTATGVRASAIFLSSIVLGGKTLPGSSAPTTANGGIVA